MTQYINKPALVAEIERLREEEYPCDTFEESTGYYNALDEVSSFLNTLEVKEMKEEPVSKDLEEATDKHLVEKGYLLTANNGEHLAEVEAKGLFKAGAQWQKQQLIEKACEWLNNFYSEDRHCYLVAEDIKAFKQAMEESK